MPKTIFVNLPVRDLAASTAFYEALGFEKNPMFSDDNASSVMWSDAIVFMLLKHEFYSTFTQLPIADARKASGAIFALSRDSREDVDAMVEAAGKAGGRPDVRPAQDHGWMYVRTFEDPDGNVFEPAFMDPSAMAGQPDGAQA